MFSQDFVMHVRFFCRKHEKRWKDAERLEYERQNGVLLDANELFSDKKDIEEKLMRTQRVS